MKIPGKIQIRAYAVSGRNCAFEGKILEQIPEGQETFELDNDSIKKFLIAKYGKLKSKEGKILAFKVFVFGGRHPRTLFPVDAAGNKLKIMPYGVINSQDYERVEKYLLAKSVKKTLMK
jgi:hypothetical protein